MKEKDKPCEKCPWTIKGQPDITERLREHAREGNWFCCHVHLGTCYGAELYKEKAGRLN